MKKIRERSLRLESLEDRMLLAVTAGGEEVAASALYAAPLATEATQLDTPTNLTATCPANRKLSVSWDAVANASSYTVYYKISTSSSWTAKSFTTNSAELTNLNQTSAYDIKVVAVGDGTNYTNSEESEVIGAFPNTSYTTTVTTLTDINAVTNPTGEISFRQAVYFASRTGDTVTFADGLEGTIDLASYGQITIVSTAKGFTVEGDNRITLTNSGSAGTDRIFYCAASSDGYDVTLNDLTITGCSVTNDSSLYNRGGAIFIWNTSFGSADMNYIHFHMNNCTLTNNSAAEKGGAFYAYGGALTANNCIFSGNSSNEGGAVSIMAGDVFLTDTTFTGNTAVGTANSSALGGALSLSTYYCSTIDECTFSGNAAKVSGLFGSNAEARGGAIVLFSSTDKTTSSDLIITDTQITGNFATCADGQSYCETTKGGAIYASDAGARFYNCSITGNGAVNGLNVYGGAIYMIGDNSGYEELPSDAQLFFFMTDISDNYIGYKESDIWSGGGAGGCVARGGAFFAGGVFHMVNCTMTENTIYASKAFSNYYSKIGSAIFAASNGVLYNTTIAGNRVVDQSLVGYGDDYAALVIYGSMTIKSSAILGNYYIDTINNTQVDNDIFSHAWNEGSSATSFFSSAYNPDAIGKDDGYTEEQAWSFSDSCIQVTDYEAYYNDYAAGDYTLAAGSAGVDAVNMSEWDNFGYEYDIRYYLNGDECYRVVNSIVDIGAYEYQATPTFEVTIEDYEGAYDGEEHSITVSGLDTGDVVYYSEDGSSWTTTGYSYTEVGTYTVYVKVEREGYQDFTGSGTVTINEVTQKLQVAVVVSTSAASATEVSDLPSSISTAAVGDTLYAQVWILNADGSELGCTGGYLDLTYTDAALTAGSYTVSSIYSQMATYVDASTDGLVACFGGCSQTGVNDLAVSQWALLGTFTFTASVAGDAEIASALPTLNGTHITGLNLSRAGEGNFADSEIVFGSASFTVTSGGSEQLDAPVISTGNRGVYVSYGANRHQIQWGEVENASGYELQYSADGTAWTSIETTETSAVVTGLTYGTEVTYRVRALGDDASYTDSDWSAAKDFLVCPMDINNDGDISGGDRTLMGLSWFSEEGDDEYQYYCDINGDGDVSGADRGFLSSNWMAEADEEDLTYPPAKRADAFFADFASADLDVDLGVF